MRCRQPERDLSRVVARPPHAQRAALPRAAQRRAVDQLLDQIQPPGVLPDVVDGDDVGVGEGSGAVSLKPWQRRITLSQAPWAERHESARENRIVYGDRMPGANRVGPPGQTPGMLTTSVLLTEDRLAREFASALDRHEIPEKFFYWFPTSVRAWLDLCSDGAYRNFVRSRALLDRHADDIASLLPDGRLTVISLGAGQGDKDRLVLEAAGRRGRRALYVPVDASQSLLEMACAAWAGAGVESHGVKADIADAVHLDRVIAAAEGTSRLLMLLGNTLGAFDAPPYARMLAERLRPGDLLIVDGEIFSDTGTVAGYDNPLNRSFAFGPLRAIGLREPDDGVLRFEVEENVGGTGLYRLRKHFLPARDITLQVAGETVRWHAGRRVEMNWSGKYAAGAFEQLLEGAGLVSAARFVSQDERFVMIAARTA